MIRYAALCRRFSGEAFCHVPAGVPFDLDALVSDDDVERWSGPGEPTIYLAGDVGVALAELGRHTDRLPVAGGGSRRRIVRVAVALDRLLDLTRPETQAALGIDGGDGVFMDRDRARAVARGIRASGDCEGILVPSVAFLDQPERWNLVIFAERVAGGVAAAIEAPEEVGVIVLHSAGEPA